MKRFFQKLSLLGLLFGGIMLSFVLLLSVSLHMRRDDYLMAFFVKREMLIEKHRQKTPSIILLGGSNVAYGFNSGVLRDSLNMPVINTGIGAGIGLKFMLDNTSKYLTEGDILVIAPEYVHFFGNSAYGNTDLAQLLYIDWSLCENFHAKQAKAVIFGTKNLVRDYLLLSPLKRESKKLIFKLSDFNRYGDMAAHWTMQPLPYEHASPGEFKTVNTSFLDYYEHAVEALRNRGVQVVIIPPSFSETSYRNMETKLIPLFAELEKRNLAFAIPPQEAAYPDSLFFDTHYHLGYEGVMIRTNRLVNLLLLNGKTYLHR
ncbi:MAG: hypothetical protein LBP98_07360 [Tannerella sp.]|jgi:hypothetical protein|nr:hypothetical protein [Tannerella sp.]